MDNAIPVEATPVRPNKVRLIPPEGIEPGRAFSGWFSRRHLAYAPGAGFVTCGEYAFYYHTTQHYVYGVCQACGDVYVKPILPRPPLTATDRFMEGALKR